MSNKRDTAIDILKGIAIILMIIGHWLTLKTPLYNYIYSFHMPLFFLISGFFYKPKPIKERVSADAKLLLIPYLFISIFTVFIRIFLVSNTSNALLRGVYSIAAVSTEKIIFAGEHIFDIGPIWFLPALFWIRLVFNALYKCGNKTLLCIASFGLTLLAVWSNSYYFIPLGIQHGLSNFIFYYIGYLTRKYIIIDKVQKNSIIYVAFALLYWLIFAPSSHYKPTFQLLTWRYPIDLITALCGTIVFYEIAKLLDKRDSWVKSQLNLWGRYSLVGLSFHTLPYLLSNEWITERTLRIYEQLHLPLVGESIPKLLLLLLVPYLAILIVPKTRWGRAIFSIKK